MADPPTRPVGPHYLGSEGEAYYRLQAGGGTIGAALTARQFLGWVSPEDVVLDFGCGGGQVLAALPASRRLGVEVNPAARGDAAALGLELYERLEEVESDSVQVAIANHSLEHALQPLDELVELRRVLTAGGRLVVVVPLEDSRADRDVFGADPNHHLYSWTPLTLANLARAAGFTVSSCRVRTRAWPPGYRLLARLPDRIFDALGWLTAVLRRRRELVLVASR